MTLSNKRSECICVCGFLSVCIFLNSSPLVKHLKIDFLYIYVLYIMYVYI